MFVLTKNGAKATGRRGKEGVEGEEARMMFPLRASDT